MQDTKTQSLWNHITGQAMYGEMAGRALDVSGTLLQVTAAQALAIDPEMPISISGRPFANSGPGFASTAAGRGGPRGGGRGAGRGIGVPGGGPSPNAQLSEMFAVTLGEEDTRRERMELGLGVWSEDVGLRRFYPFDLIRERGALIDQVGGRNLLVYYDATASVPAALYVSSEVTGVEGGEVRLANGQTVVAGQLVDPDGNMRSPDRPNQVFTRWYGFSLTFPGPEIYDQ